MSAEHPTWRELQERGRARLDSAVEARRLVERASGLEGADLLLALDERVPARVVPFFDRMLERRAAGEPLQYVLGRWGFRRLDLLVDARVLIPRPETEQVVEVALAEAARLPRPIVAVDLGTGSGAIALSLAVELGSRCEVWATDASADALAVARANLAGLGGFAAQRVRIAEGSWFSALPAELEGRLGLVVSNPPYIAEREVPDLPPDVAGWEPRSALVAGPTGLEDVERVVAGAAGWLATPGVVVVEIAPHQAAAATELARVAGFADVEVRPDLAGRARALVARR